MADRLWTGRGDDGTTGLLFGGRVRKDSDAPAAYGAVDEAQAFLGLARAEAGRDTELDELLIAIERDLYVLMAELATAPENRSKLVAGTTMVTAAMIELLETSTEKLAARFTLPKEFVLPGQGRVSALLDVARTVVRRAERLAVPIADPTSNAVPYLNRLSTLLWTMARWQETETLPARQEDS
jgi:cob(I)alamin adenosyltransferase